MSDLDLLNLSEEKIFKYFFEISKLPRCSRKEDEIANYIEDFAKNHNLSHTRDLENNLILRKDTGSCKTVALQAHIDMVCLKSSASQHNFSVDPLNIVMKNKILKAEDTTLGADNGIGVAYMLALLDDENYIGPNLECIFTSNEEDGMTGANFLDLSEIKSTYLLNLDSEEEGKLYVSCAGGVICNMTVPTKFKFKEGTIYEIFITGLKGGHSGLEIDKKRANAIKLAARIMNYLQEESVFYKLIDLSGGKKHNAIPESARIKILLKDKAQFEKLDAIINNCQLIFKKEYKHRDPNIQVSMIEGSTGKFRVYSRATTVALVGVLTLIHDGVISMSNEIPNLVETSTNIGQVYTKNQEICIVSSIRSSKDEAIKSTVDMFNQLKTAFNLHFTTEHSYPAWKYNKNSTLKELAKKVYMELFEKELEEIAIHAGLECGFFSNKKADLDIISFGPTINNIHTTNEYVDIDSVRRIYTFLRELLLKLN